MSSRSRAALLDNKPRLPPEVLALVFRAYNELREEDQQRRRRAAVKAYENLRLGLEDGVPQDEKDDLMRVCRTRYKVTSILQASRLCRDLFLPLIYNDVKLFGPSQHHSFLGRPDLRSYKHVRHLTSDCGMDEDACTTLGFFKYTLGLRAGKLVSEERADRFEQRIQGAVAGGVLKREEFWAKDCVLELSPRNAMRMGIAVSLGVAEIRTSMGRLPRISLREAKAMAAMRNMRVAAGLPPPSITLTVNQNPAQTLGRDWRTLPDGPWKTYLTVEIITPSRRPHLSLSINNTSFRDWSTSQASTLLFGVTPPPSVSDSAIMAILKVLKEKKQVHVRVRCTGTGHRLCRAETNPHPRLVVESCQAAGPCPMDAELECQAFVDCFNITKDTTEEDMTTKLQTWRAALEPDGTLAGAGWGGV